MINNNEIKNWCEKYNCYITITKEYKGEPIFRSIFGCHENVSHFTSLAIPEGIHELPDGAFIGNNWENLNTIDIPSTMKIIEDYSFHKNRVMLLVDPNTIDKKLFNKIINNNYIIKYKGSGLKESNNIIHKEISLLLDTLYNKKILKMNFKINDKIYSEIYSITQKINEDSRLISILTSLTNINRSFTKYLDIMDFISTFHINDTNLYSFDDIIINKYKSYKKELYKEKTKINNEFNHIKRVLSI